jgi:CrcB protein
MIWTLSQVAIGGAIGASGRYLTYVAAMRLMGEGFPWGTLAVNVVGSFLMGVVVEVLARTGNTHFAPFLMTGILGGFTTFSAFSLDTISMIERGQAALATAYITGSVVLSLAGLFAGLLVARGIQV